MAAWEDRSLPESEALDLVRDAAQGGIDWQQRPLEFTIRALAVLVLKLAEDQGER